MARTRRLDELREEVRQRADIEGALVAFPDAELTRYINQSIARLHRAIARIQPDLLVANTTITTTTDQETYALPATFYSLIGVPEAELGGPRPQRLKRWEWADRTAYQYINGWSWNQPVAYRLHGSDTISFLPIPGGAHDVKIFYVPAPTDLAADGDTYNGRAGWEEWVVIDAAIKVAIKEEQDPAALMAEREGLMREIRQDLPQIDRGAPARVQSVERDAELRHIMDGW